MSFTLDRSYVRKTVSITLAFIMVFGSVSFAIPYSIPSAYASHNANLFVSAENPTFSNYFAGPQVIEVVIVDSDISDVSSPLGEPDVTINGNKLRMAQATDGNWYGYFADRSQALLADSTVGLTGTGLDFGKFCASGTTATIFGVSFSETTGFAIAHDTGIANAVDGTGLGTPSLSACGGGMPSSGTIQNHVTREPKSLNTDPGAAGVGQIGLEADAWPIIQLYDFTPTGNVVVTYNKGGGSQTTTLTFDTADSFATHSLDRLTYPQNAEIHVTINDAQLNIDPTDEDSWTWDTTPGSPKVFYQAFDEGGNNDANGGSGLVDISSSLSSLMFGSNGLLTVDPAATGPTVVEFTNNALQGISVTDGVTSYSNILTLTELGPTSSIFGNHDAFDNSNLDVLLDAARGGRAIIGYNSNFITAVIGFSFGTISLGTPAGDWSSGEAIPVTLVDGDANKNSRTDEDLDVFRSDAVIPALITGSPITLEGASSVNFYSGSADLLTGGTAISSSTSDSFSKLLVIDTRSPTPNMTFEKMSIGLGADTNALKTALLGNVAGESGTNWINYDLRSLQQLGITDFSDTSMELYFGATDPIPVTIASSGTLAGPTGLIAIPESAVTAIESKGAADIHLAINFDASNDSAPQGSVSSETDTQRIAFDIFSFGFLGDGELSEERINNAIYRFELEETSDATAVFAGSAEFVMLNQLNILDPTTYSGLSTISDQVTFVVHEDLRGASAPRISYLDLGADGISTQIADQEDAPTHTGVVSFDSNAYGVGDIATVTLSDTDLDTDANLIDIYTVVPPNAAEIASDAIGKADLLVLSSGIELGSMLEISFADQRWVNGTIFCGSPATAFDGLYSSGFVLVETSSDSGMFLGGFEVPPDFCDTSTTSIVPSQVRPLVANYVDYRDVLNEIALVSSSSFVTGTSGSVDSATGTGAVSFSTDNGEFTALSAVSEGDLPTSGKPIGVSFPDGFFDWSVVGLTPGDTITLTLTYPAPVPIGAQYWKVIGSTWTDVTSLLGDDDGDDTITLTITDGGLGDADGIANGEISDPGGAGTEGPNMSIFKSINSLTLSDDIVDAGDIFNYTITVHNIGTIAATNVTVIDNVFSPLTGLGVGIVGLPSSCLLLSSGFSCTNITMNPFDTIVIEYEVQVDSPATGFVLNEAQVSSDPVEPSSTQEDNLVRHHQAIGTIPPLQVFIPPGSSSPGCENSSTCFLPIIINVTTGDTVTWHNNDTAAHTVTSGNPTTGPDAIFDSGLFMAGSTFAHTFNSPGLFEYFCIVHPWQIGWVSVDADTSPVANNDFYTTQAGVAINNLNVLLNDTDADFDPLTIIAVSPTLNGGTAVANASSTGINYSPPSGFRGVDMFGYVVHDGTTGVVANVTMTILGTNGKIVFQSNRDGDNEIYTMNSDGTAQTNISNNPANDGYPSVSPDGTKIAFSSNRDGNMEIYVMNIDGTGVTRLTSVVGAEDILPSWSPDNSKILFRSSRDGLYQIYVMNADGTSQTNISNNGENDVQASFSPDGTKIAFTSMRDGIEQIYTMNSDGTAQTNISNIFAGEKFPSWSVDSSRIIFTSNIDGNDEIYIMNADGTERTNISNNPDRDYTSSMSPDGTKISFASTRDGIEQIYIMNTDGSGQTRLTNSDPAFDWYPSWGTASDTLFGGPVAFDQLSYIIETSGYVTVTDQGANLNPTAIDNIAVTLSTTSGSNILLNIPENAIDSGVFVSNMIKFTSGPTVATTDLHVEPIDEVQATYQADSATAPIELSSGARAVPTETNSILFSPGTFQIENGATVSVYAPSANANNDAIESITAFVSSSTFPAGLRITLQEDSTSSGIFVNPTLIPLTASLTDYANPKLHVTADDKIFVKYPASGITFYLRTETGSTYNILSVGLPIDIPFAGDWDGDGMDTVALFRPHNGYTFLRNAAGSAYLTLTPGTTGAQAGDVPISGDWDGDGRDSVGYFRSSTLTFNLLNENGALYQSLSAGITGAQAGDIPIAGDWDGDGMDSVGYFRPSVKTFYLRDGAGSAYNTFAVGLPRDIPFAGDWDGDGMDTVALFRPHNGYTFLRNAAGSAYLTLTPGTTGAQAGDIPIAGDWDNDASHKSSVGYGRPLDPATNFASTIVYPIPQEEELIGTYTGPQDALVCDESNNVDGICQAWIEPNVGLAIELVPGARWTESCDASIAGDCATAGSLDVYVEIDYMTGRQPSQLAIDQVVQAFKDSGVNLHVLVDEDIGRFDPVIKLSEVTPGTEPTFDEIKRAFFGTAEERTQGTDVLAAKAQVYHYALWANSLKETPTSSGYAEIGGNDIIITLGSFTDGIGSVDEQAGTFMHELGHNLKLLHGGGDSINYKPNYLSVMSYQYQFPPDLLPNRPLDYSRQNLTPLIEDNLSEQNGIGIIDPITGALLPATDKTGNPLQTIIGGIDETGNPLPPIPVPTGQPADFNRINGFEQPAISQNIHFYDKYNGDDATLQILNGYDDWDNLDFNFRDSATFLSGDIHTDPLVLNEAPIHEITTPDPIPAPDVDTQTPTANAQIVIMLPSATDLDITLTGADPNLDPLSFAISTPPTSGVLSPITPLDSTSTSVTYSTGPARFDSFNFTVSDGLNTSVPANVTIIKNAKPTADSQSVSTGADTPITLVLEGSDADGDSLQFIVPVTPLNGVLGPITQLGSSATIEYTPDAGFDGTDSIQFKVRDGFEESELADVEIIVLPPASSSTDSSTGTGTVSFETDNGGISELSAIDPDDPGLPAGKPVDVSFDHGLFSFTVTGIAPGSNANITITYPSAVPVGSQYWKVAGGTWTDATSLLGDDDGDNILVLTITDGGFGDADGIANGQILDPSGVAILEGTAPVAEDQTITVNEDTAEIAITLTATDPQDDPLTFTILGQQNTNLGTIVQDPGSASVLYLPTPNKNGQDSFTFVANDGTADSNTATITINITPVNDVPVVPPQIDVPVQQDEDKTFIITASDVDTLDENPDSLTFQITSLPTKGSIIAIVAVDATSAQFTYRPNPGVTGDDSFNYHVTDTTNTPSNEGIVLLHIEPIVIPPTPETLQEQKQDVLSQLESIDSDNTRTQKIIQKAVKHITKSTTDELWESDGNSVDPKQGKKVFTEEANGVKKLMKILMTASTDDDDWDEDIDDDEFSDDSDPQTPFETSASITSTVQTVIDTLVNVDRTLAEDAIAQATTHAATLDGKDKKKADKFLEQIEKSIQKAEDKLDEGKFHQGILQYKKAWQSAQSILKLG